MSWFGSKFSSRGSMRFIGSSLERIADCLEYMCCEAYGYNVRPPKADKSGEPPEMMYTDEEADVLREIRDEIERRKGLKIQEEEDVL